MDFHLRAPHPAVCLLLALLAAAAAVTDFRSRRIPNLLTLAALAAALLANTAIYGLPGLRFALHGLAFAALLSLPLFLLRAMGGGDVKLLLAVGALVGAANWLAIFAFTSVLGGFFAIAIAIARRRLRHTLASAARLLLTLASARAPHRQHPQWDVAHPQSLRLPYGVVIALGSLAFLLAAQSFPPLLSP
jgi:prepilin peptidase CpaA